MLLFQAKSVIPTIDRPMLNLHPIKSIVALIETIYQKAIADLMDNFMADYTKEPELKIWQSAIGTDASIGMLVTH